MKTRMIREVIKEKGYEHGVVHVLETMNEQLQEINTGFMHITEITVALTTQMEKLNAINDGMKNKLELLQKRRGDDLGVSLHTELVEDDQS